MPSAKPRKPATATRARKTAPPGLKSIFEAFDDDVLREFARDLALLELAQKNEEHDSPEQEGRTEAVEKADREADAPGAAFHDHADVVAGTRKKIATKKKNRR